jgi:ABC-type Mn2+/Zn2+ transport system permease subunit
MKPCWDNISEDLARSESINVKKYNLMCLGLIAAVIIALGVKMVGGLQEGIVPNG